MYLRHGFGFFVAWVLVMSLALDCNALPQDNDQWVVVFHKDDAKHRVAVGTAGAVRKILMGQTRYWDNGEEIDLVMPSRESGFLKGLSERVGAGSDTLFQRHWLRLTFGGRVLPPKFYSSMEEVIRYVKEHPNALGVVKVEYLRPNDKLLIRPLTESS